MCSFDNLHNLLHKKSIIHKLYNIRYFPKKMIYKLNHNIIIYPFCSSTVCTFSFKNRVKCFLSIFFIVGDKFIVKIKQKPIRANKRHCKHILRNKKSMPYNILSYDFFIKFFINSVLLPCFSRNSNKYNSSCLNAIATCFCLLRYFWCALLCASVSAICL